MKLKDKNNEQFIDYFFKNHKVFICDNLPWKLFNFENSKAQKENNYHTRIEYLFSENGFFNETYKEKNPKYIIHLSNISNIMLIPNAIKSIKYSIDLI